MGNLFSVKNLLVMSLILLSFVPLSYFLYSKKVSTGQLVPKYPTVSFVSRELKPGEQFRVQTARIVDGNSFYLELEGGHWIKALIPVVVKEEASAFVVDALQKSTDPSVILKSQFKNEIWIIDLLFTQNGKVTHLDALLKEKGMVFQ